MIKQFHYDSDMAGGSLMIRESRVVAGLLIANSTPEQWDQAIRIDNVLQKRTPASARRNAQAIRKRLERMEPEFWRALRDGDEEVATQVAFCAALERNLLLVEFMETVLRDAYLARAEKLESYKWSDFLEDRTHRDPAIADWTESTRKKMGQVAYRMLAEVGYLKDTRTMALQHVVIRPEIRTLLDNHYRQRIKQCLQVSVLTR